MFELSFNNYDNDHKVASTSSATLTFQLDTYALIKT